MGQVQAVELVAGDRIRVTEYNGVGSRRVWVDVVSCERVGNRVVIVDEMGREWTFGPFDVVDFREVK